MYKQLNKNPIFCSFFNSFQFQKIIIKKTQHKIAYIKYYPESIVY